MIGSGWGWVGVIFCWSTVFTARTPTVAHAGLMGFPAIFLKLHKHKHTRIDLDDRDEGRGPYTTVSIQERAFFFSSVLSSTADIPITGTSQQSTFAHPRDTIS